MTGVLILKAQLKFKLAEFCTSRKTKKAKLSLKAETDAVQSALLLFNE